MIGEAIDAPAWSILAMALVAGAVGSPHCAAMCGPLVVGCARGAGFRRSSLFVQQLGRLLAYSALGAVAGGIGRSLDGLAAARSGFHVLPFVVGGLLIVLGIVSIAGPWFRLPHFSVFSQLTRIARDAVRGAPLGLRPFFLGVLSAALPCGLLHTMVLGSAGTGSAWAGASMLAAFFVGTLPALLAVGFSARRIAQSLGGDRARWVEAVACVGAGVVLVLSGFGSDGVVASCCETANP